MPENLIPEDLSEQQLKWGYWFVTHKIALRRILSVVLIVADAALLGYSGYLLTLDLLSASAREKMVAELGMNLLNPSVTQAQAARPLSASNPQILASDGKYDFVSQISNPNGDFVAHFSYRFVAGSFATDPQHGFALPGEQKPAVALGVTSAFRPSKAELEISDISWKRIDKHLIPDWSSYVSEHLDMPISEIAYEPGIEIVPGKSAIGRTAFKLTNDTGYGYYGLRVLILMYRGPALAAVNSTVFPTVNPGESRTGEVTWYEDYGAITLIKVIPEVDITDPSVYIRPS